MVKQKNVVQASACGIAQHFKFTEVVKAFGGNGCAIVLGDPLPQSRCKSPTETLDCQLNQDFCSLAFISVARISLNKM